MYLAIMGMLGSVVVVSSNFIMNGGFNSNSVPTSTRSSTNTGNGGGVYIANNASFTMSDGTISGNSSSGGGVCVYWGNTFIKSGSGGIIYSSNAPKGLTNMAKSG